MSLSVLGLGGRPPTYRQQQRPQSPPRGGAGGSPPPKAAEDEVSTSSAAAEQARTEIAAINQAIRATEESLAMVSAARLGLEAVHQRLARMAGNVRRVLQDRSAGAGPLSGQAWDEVLRLLGDDGRAIDVLARDTRFGGVRLLDGSCGCRGAAFGPWLEFVAAGDDVRSSPPEGFPVVLRQEPTRAAVLGERSLTADRIAAGENLAVEADDQWVEIRTQPGQSLADVVRALNDAIARKALPLAVLAATGDRLLVHHRRYGSGWRFRVRSSTPGILSASALSGAWGGVQVVENGRDVVGAINDEPAEGRQQVLTGLPGNRTTAGLAVRYTGTPPPGFEPAQAKPRPAGWPAHAAPQDGWKDRVLEAGRVLVVQRSLNLRVGGDDWVLRLDAVTCADLGRAGFDPDGLASVADALQAAPGQAGSALAAIERGREQVARTLRAAERMEHVVLAGHLARLRVESENRLATRCLSGSPGEVRAWVARLGGQLRAEGADALTYQRYPRPTALLRLLNGSDGNGPAAGQETRRG